MFHALDVAAFLVLAGVFLFLGRRVRDPGAIAVERANDFLALAGLFAVSVTGLMLTASTLWMGGRFYTFLTTVHALTVILGPDVHAVRQALPHLPAARESRRAVLQAGRRRGTAAALQRVRRRLRVGAAESAT